MAVEDEYLETLAREVYEALVEEAGTNRVVPVGLARELPLALRRRVARLWLMDVAGSEFPPPLREVEAVMALVDRDEAGKYHLVSERLVVYRDYGHLVAGVVPGKKKPGRIPKETIERFLTRLVRENLGAMGYTFRCVGKRFRVEVPLKKPPPSPRLRRTGEVIEPSFVSKAFGIMEGLLQIKIMARKPGFVAKGALLFAIPKADVKKRVVFRAPRKGDRVRVGRGTKELSRYLSDKKVPKVVRGNVLVVEIGEGVVMVPGAGERLRTSAFAKATADRAADKFWIELV
jgi:tRNA(Ile)-lysidine synthetase-like protein